MLLAIGAIAIGLACLTRYAGLALVATGLAGLLRLSPRRWRRRLDDALLFLVLSTAPLALWLLRNLRTAGSGTDRTAHFEAAGLDDARAALVTLASWLGPGTDRVILFPRQEALMITVLVLFLLTLGGAAVWLFARSISTDGTHELRQRLCSSPILFALLVPIYGAFLWVSISFFDPAIPLGFHRILAPLFLPCLLCVVYLGHRISLAAPGGWLVVALRTAGLAMAAVYLVAGGLVGAHLFQEGRGFTGQAWRYESLAEWMVSLDQGTPIFSDHPAAIRFLFARSAQALEEFPELGHAEHRQAVLVLFEDARRFPPRLAAARKQATETGLRRLLEDLAKTEVLSDGNAKVYLVSMSL